MFPSQSVSYTKYLVIQQQKKVDIQNRLRLMGFSEKTQMFQHKLYISKKSNRNYIRYFGPLGHGKNQFL